MQCSEPQGEAMRRRDFITHIGGVAVVWPLVAQAQEPGRTYRLAFLIPSPRQAPATIALFDELHRNGFNEGQNLVVIPDGFEADTEHPGELAAALVKAAPDAIITGPALPLRAFQTITHTIPLIGMTEDMVAEGLVASLARPGGNITGLSLLSLELDTKRQEILIEAVPGARRIAAMADSNAAPTYHLEALKHAARSRGVELSVFRVGGPGEIISAIDAAKASGVEALNFLASPLFAVPGSRNNKIVLQRIAALRLPAIFQFPEIAEAGALAGYGARISDLYRQRARIAAQVLRGTKPADIPVQQPDRFELVINLRAAKAIGVEVPATLVARVDKLIE
jgi:putative tryptophan/tyrosine transport system substrate-binding protein